MKARDVVALDIGRIASTAIDDAFDSRELTGLPEAIDGPGASSNDHERTFRNREQELEEVISALHNDAGDHFWLFVAPPQLGKTWFLRETGDRLRKRRTRCHVHLVDVRQFAGHPVMDDPIALLARMYEVSEPSPDALKIATAISGTARYNLCLLDSAELLSEDTIRGLRKGLEQIDQLVKEGNNRDARLALVVGSRQDDAWRGVAPLRLSIRNLTGFRQDVVLDALYDLARETGNARSRSELSPLASQIHQLSEGLPALLAGYLAWIRREQWIQLSRLGSRDSFDEIATPYIDDDLLSPASLCGRRPDAPHELRVALIAALHALVPYRFFTGSHLSHHAKDRALQDALGRLGWSEEELLAAVTRTDVLLLPQDELWDMISPPIRRLLFRHWYAQPGSRARAHQVAREFLESYARSLAGRERAEVSIECVWHEAEALSLTQDAGKAGLLIALATRLSAALTGPPAPAGHSFHDQAVRNFTARRIRDDAELAGAIDDQAVLATIANLMLRPDGGNMS